MSAQKAGEWQALDCCVGAWSLCTFCRDEELIKDDSREREDEGREQRCVEAAEYPDVYGQLDSHPLKTGGFICG